NGASGRVPRGLAIPAARAASAPLRGRARLSFTRLRGRNTNARSLAVLARRVVAGVGGVLQELVGPVGPELTHAREGVDDRVLKPAADALDLADVDVLDRVAEVVELHGAARGGGAVHAPERRADLLPVLDVAARRLERRPEHH